MTNRGKRTAKESAAVAPLVDAPQPEVENEIVDTPDPAVPAAFEGSGNVPAQFQSKQAEEGAKESAHAPEDDGEIREAKVTQEPVPRQMVMVSKIEAVKMVKIRPRETLKRFRVGRDYYQVVAGKDTHVPQHVANLLDQKGYL